MYLFWTRLPATGRNISFLCSKKLEVYSFCLRQFHASISGNVNRLNVKKNKQIFPIEFILVCPKTVIRRIGNGNVEILKCYSNATFRSTRFFIFLYFSQYVCWEEANDGVSEKSKGKVL
jgi:hypothetical protein